MPIDDDLREFFSEEPASVVADAEKFRKKLTIGSEAFRYLNSAGRLGDFMSGLSGAVSTASLGYMGWTASLGVLGKIGLSLGLIATPVGWLAAAGAGGIASVYLTRRLFRAAKREAVTEVPNFINTPLDVLGAAVCDVICPVLLSVAHADGDFSHAERETIRRYFVEQWGIDPQYVEGLLAYDEANLQAFSWEGLRTALKNIEATGDLKYETIAEEIMRVATDVMTCDNEIHPDETYALSRLDVAIREQSLISSLKNKFFP